MILRHTQSRVNKLGINPIPAADSSSKSANKVANMDTDKIIKRIDKMEEDMLSDRQVKDKAIMDRIDEISDQLTTTLTDNTRRIGLLETGATNTEEKLQTLTDGLAELKSLNEKLSAKLLNSVAHSRRLNLHFLGLDEQKDEDVMVKVNTFLVNTLQIDPVTVDAMLIRAAHRLGVFKQGKTRAIIVGFVRMADRDLIYSKAYLCRGTDFAVRIDLPPELVTVRDEQLLLRKELLKSNPTALLTCSYRNFKPVLICKFRGKVQPYDPARMQVHELEAGDPRHGRR